jgi:hypothetical protein
MSNANPLNYDAKYPQVADSSVNEDAKIDVMAKNMFKEVMFQSAEKVQYYGKIVGVLPQNRYMVEVEEDIGGRKKEAVYVLPESLVHFVEDISTKIK